MLQGFNGTLTMLDSRAGSNGDFDSSKDTNELSSNSDTFSSSASDIDDEIPF